MHDTGSDPDDDPEPTIRGTHEEVTFAQATRRPVGADDFNPGSSMALTLLEEETHGRLLQVYSLLLQLA